MDDLLDAEADKRLKPSRKPNHGPPLPRTHRREMHPNQRLWQRQDRRPVLHVAQCAAAKAVRLIRTRRKVAEIFIGAHLALPSKRLICYRLG
jgi:hypothetical protein